MKKLYTLLSVVALSAAMNAQEFTSTYDFAGVTAETGTTDPTPVPTATNITFGSFTAVNPAVTEAYNSSGPGRFSFNTQSLGATNGSNDYAALTGSIDLTKYYQVVLTPATGFQVTLNKLTFRAQRSGTGIRTYAVRTSADNFAANLGTVSIDPANVALSTQTGNIFFFTTDESGGQNGSTITISSVTDITAPLTVRFYGWNAEGDGGTFSIDDVAFTGLVESTTAGIDTQEISGLKLFPNPLNSGATLNITSNNATDKSVAIFDILGKQVFSGATVRGTVNTSNLTAGVYIVKITEGNKTATRKLVVQ